MEIRRNIDAVTMETREPISRALELMSAEGNQWVIVLDENDLLAGVITDGDIRRWLLRQESIDLSHPVFTAVELRTEVVAHVDTPQDELEALLSPRIRFVPLVDDVGRVVAVATADAHEVRIRDRRISDHDPTFVIAEIGNNHQGSVELARELVDAAADAGADSVKFQMRTMGDLYISIDAAARQGRDLGAEYTNDLLHRFQLRDDELFEVMTYALEQGIEAFCTPWDMTSLEKLVDFGVAALKVASADLTNHPFLEAMAATGLPMLVSTGMSEEREIRAAIRLLDRSGASYVMLHCNSTYPAAPQHIRLNYLHHLANLSGRVVGYSGHERGSAISIAAVAMGARVVERHLTVDKSLEGNDHRASLLPEEFSSMVDGIREVEQALGERGGQRTMTQGERLNRENLGKSLVAAREISQGEIVRPEDLAVRSPGRGVPAALLDRITKFPAPRDLHVGDFIYDSDLQFRDVAHRDFSFDATWGIPVRYHDYTELTALSNPDLVEFHLSYRDLDVDPGDVLDGRNEHLLVVHAPELFANDHVIDLATHDDAYRKRSLEELQRVVDRTLQLRAFFTVDGPTGVIVNVGGFSESEPLQPSERTALYARVAEALASVRHPDVEFWIQTMPPFPWHFGGQRFHNLFVDPEETAAHCNRFGARLCLDISHTAMACNHLETDLADAVATLADHTAHVHIADAVGDHEEGLQIGSGNVDFAKIAAVLRDGNYSFIPEIWQGHKDQGRGFWEALAELESLGF